jgi:hypothetical protein
MTAAPAVAPDAAMVLGIASTAMPFAGTTHAEVERWLRLLRLHGQVGNALQAIGVSEGALGDNRARAAHGQPDASTHKDRDAVARVAEQAVRIAGERGTMVLGTADVLLGVMDVYGEDFDRVLQAHGTDRDEVLERLGLTGVR